MAAGPFRIARTKGQPNELAFTFSAISAGTRTLHVLNGIAGGSARASSGSITVNGAEIVGPADFNPQVGGIDRPVTLLPGQNVVRLRIAGKPGTEFSVTIEGAGGSSDDGNPCTADACDPATGQATHTPLPAGTSCEDNDLCNGRETCNGLGTCVAGAPPAVDDGNPCTSDSCSAATGVANVPVADGTSCSDGNVCNGAEICMSGVCRPGTPLPATDGNPCTADACDPLTGVSHLAVPDGTSCSDGDACNGAETCVSGVCLAGAPPLVDDHNACTSDACDPATGPTHTPVADGTGCPDGNACNGAETCASGACLAGIPPATDDGNACTADGCDPATGPTHTPVANGTSCSNGNACDGAETCSNGACLAGTPPTLSDNNPCTVDVCDPASGVSHVAVADGTSCADGNACNGAETCSGGSCRPGTPLPTDDRNPCTVDTCDPATGVAHTPVAAGTSCANADPCDGQETCDGAGACAPGTPPNLDDGNPCTVDACSSAGITHLAVADGTSCADATVCNGAETCAAGACRPGTPLVVDDGNACTVDACDPVTGVSHTPAVGALCSDGNPCNGLETCGASGSCVAGLPPVLDDGDRCTADSCDPVLGIQHPRTAGCSLPDPATVAPAVDGTVSTTLLASTRFLFEGENPIQTGVAPSAITERAAATLRGRVTTRDGLALPDARVSVFGHPELGSTLSRADGRFDLAVNGGGLVVLDVRRAGYLDAQRQTEVSWQTGAELPDLAMVPLDGSPTAVAFGAPAALQLARGSTSSDIQGTRRGTLLVQPGTLATLRRSDNTAVGASTLNVRVTEYTIGPNGPNAMPGPLPEPSAYTYAIELSADEASALGARVEFSRPVSFYVENFLGFTVGAPVPVGYYDFGSAKWIASPSGVVLKIVGSAAGLAQLDTNGDGAAESAATLSALGITDEELGALAATYAVGQSLWRFTVSHFSPWDANMGWEPLPPAPPPNGSPPPGGGCLCCGCCDSSSGGSSSGGGMSGGTWDGASGSILTCERQTLAEDLALTGTPYSLHYESDRQPGHKPLLHVPLSGSVAGTTLSRISLDVSIGGRTLHSSYPPASNAGADVYWDGRDQFGRFAQGGASADVSVGFHYPMHRVWTGQFGYSGLPGAPIELTGPAFSEAGIHAKSSTIVQRWLSEPAQKLGGWQLDVLHSYDLLTRTLYRGNGSQRGIEAVSQRLTTVASMGTEGGSNLGLGPDGTLYYVQGSSRIIRRDINGNQSFFFGARLFKAITTDPSGNVYAVTSTDGSNAIQIFRITPSGAATVIAGNGGGAGGLPPEGVPATSVALRPIGSLAVARDGTVYFGQGFGAYYVNVMAVGPDGLLRRVAGTAAGSTCGDCIPDGAEARNTALPSSTGLLTMGPEDVLYLANLEIVLRLGPDGRLRHVAGRGYGTPPVDGGDAKSAQLAIQGLGLSSDGSLYVNEDGQNMCQLRKITTDGKIYLMTSGQGDFYCYDGNFTEGAIGWQVRLRTGAGGIQSAPDGSLYFVRAVGNGDFRVMRLGPGYAGIGLSEYLIPDGSEIHVFNQAGKHQRTLLAKTGAVVRRFGYDAHGYLVSITDGDSNATTIERNSAGAPSAIVGPYGHRTTLTLDADGYLASVTSPASETHELAYVPGGLGLLSRFRTPRGFDHTFSYDENGRLQVDTDPAGGSQTLARTGDMRDYTATRTTGGGRITRYRNQVTTRGRLQTRTQPSGTVDTVETTLDGRSIQTSSDGSTSQRVQSKDPRFATSALMTTYAEARMPSGLLQQTSASASVALSNPADPLSMTSESSSVTVNGRTSSQSFVVATRTQTTSSPAGRTTTTVLDAQERPVSISVPGLTPVQIAYDGRGRPQTVTQGMRQYGLAYDASGRLESVTDPLLRTQSYTYDSADRVLSQTLPDGRQVGFTYDASGNLASLTPPGRPAHVFEWTSIDQESRYSPPDLGAGAVATSRSYNLDRQQTRVVRPDGREVDYLYGAVTGRLDSVSIARGTYLYGYDSAGRVSSIAAPGGPGLTFSYDGSLPLSTVWSGLVGGSVTRTYDASFRATNVGVNGSNIALGYDNDDLLTSVGALTMSRNAQNGLLMGTTLGSVTDSFGYNGFGEVTSYAAQAGSAALLGFDYTRDALGRIQQRTETLLGPSHVFAYAYDLAGRLTDVTRDGVAAGHYEWDPNGNRTLANGVPATYDAQDRLLTYGTKSYTYTANGELATKTDSATGAVTAYSYDELGNLLRVDLPDGRMVEYVIDGLNRRVAKKLDGVVVSKWLWQSQLRIAAELDASNAVVSRFIYATKSNVPDYMVKGGVTYKILTDQVGTPRMVVRADTGAAVQQTSRDEFGVLISESGDTTLHPFGFAGGLFDRDTGLVRFGARDYDAETGRWTTKDPIRFAGGLTSLYLYEGSDSVNRTDPSGLGDPDNPSAGEWWPGGKTYCPRGTKKWSPCLGFGNDDGTVEKCKFFKGPDGHYYMYDCETVRTNTPPRVCGEVCVPCPEWLPFCQNDDPPRRKRPKKPLYPVPKWVPRGPRHCDPAATAEDYHL